MPISYYNCDYLIHCIYNTDNMKRLLYICGILTLISCDNSKKAIHFDQDAIIKEIELILSNYHIDINKNGLTAEFAYLDKSLDFF